MSSEAVGSMSMGHCVRGWVSDCKRESECVLWRKNIKKIKLDKRCENWAWSERDTKRERQCRVHFLFFCAYVYFWRWSGPHSAVLNGFLHPFDELVLSLRTTKGMKLLNPVLESSPLWKCFQIEREEGGCGEATEVLKDFWWEDLIIKCETK